MTKELIIKFVDGQWFAMQGGKHLTATQVLSEIAEGTPYRFGQTRTQHINEVNALRSQNKLK